MLSPTSDTFRNCFRLEIMSTMVSPASADSPTSNAALLLVRHQTGVRAQGSLHATADGCNECAFARVLAMGEEQLATLAEQYGIFTGDEHVHGGGLAARQIRLNGNVSSGGGLMFHP